MSFIAYAMSTRQSLLQLIASIRSKLSWAQRPESEMQSASSLYAALFPGESYTPKQADKLLSKLKEVTRDLEATLSENNNEEGAASGGRKNKKARSELDFTQYQRRYVALQFLYLGHDYDGLARQETTPRTIEAHLFAALTKTRLIPLDYDWRELKYSRAGRTDKGVSALGQVVALLLRSAAKADQPAIEESEEYDYPAMLNKVLPGDIRVLGWTTVPDDFSARFSARYREYKYVIVNDNGHFDVPKMQQAAAFLIGRHDYRNLCKPDVTAVKSFVRDIFEARVEPIENSTMLEFYVKGTGFLWHQVRCMVSLLMMVGRGDEDPSIIKQLLDVETNPRKPQYPMASDEPLLLSACEYADLTFRRSQVNYECIQQALEQRLHSHMVRGTLLKIILGKMGSDGVLEVDDGNATRKRRLNTYIPVLDRPKERTIEERKAAIADKKAAAQQQDE